MVNTKIKKKVGLDPKKVELYQYVFNNGTSEELCFLMAVLMLDRLPGVKIRPAWLQSNVPVPDAYQDLLDAIAEAGCTGVLMPGVGTKLFLKEGGTIDHLLQNLQDEATCFKLVLIFYDMVLSEPTEKAVLWQLLRLGEKAFPVSQAQLEDLRKDFLDDLALKDEDGFFSI